MAPSQKARLARVWDKHARKEIDITKDLYSTRFHNPMLHCFGSARLFLMDNLAAFLQRFFVPDATVCRMRGTHVPVECRPQDSGKGEYGPNQK